MIACLEKGSQIKWEFWCIKGAWLVFAANYVRSKKGLASQLVEACHRLQVDMREFRGFVLSLSGIRAPKIKKRKRSLWKKNWNYRIWKYWKEAYIYSEAL